MSDDAFLHLQLVVGLSDKHGNRYGREILVRLAQKHGINGLTVGDPKADTVLGGSPMVSQAMQGIWKDTVESSVLLVASLPVSSVDYATETSRWQALVGDILKEMYQDAVLWFPAVMRPGEKVFTNYLLEPVIVFRPEMLVVPDLKWVFGRPVSKTLSLIGGPLRAGKPSLVVYESSWDETPYFLPNTHLSRPYFQAGQQELIERDVRLRYPFMRGLALNVRIDDNWWHSSLKKTGDRLKAKTLGAYAEYTFQFAVIDILDEFFTDPDAEFYDLQGRKCVFRTVEELTGHRPTVSHNKEVLLALKKYFPAWFTGVAVS